MRHRLQLAGVITRVSPSPLDKMAAISQTMFSGAFSWMKSFVFWLKFHWNVLLRVQLTATHPGSDNGLAPNRRQAIIWTNADLINWRIYAALVGDELMEQPIATNVIDIWLKHFSLKKKHFSHLRYFVQDPVCQIITSGSASGRRTADVEEIDRSYGNRYSIVLVDVGVNYHRHKNISIYSRAPFTDID